MHPATSYLYSLRPVRHRRAIRPIAGIPPCGDDSSVERFGRPHAKHARTTLPSTRSPCTTLLHEVRVPAGLRLLQFQANTRNIRGFRRKMKMPIRRNQRCNRGRTVHTLPSTSPTTHLDLCRITRPRRPIPACHQTRDICAECGPIPTPALYPAISGVTRSPLLRWSPDLALDYGVMHLPWCVHSM